MTSRCLKSWSRPGLRVAVAALAGLRRGRVGARCCKRAPSEPRLSPMLFGLRSAANALTMDSMGRRAQCPRHRSSTTRWTLTPAEHGR